MNKEIRLHSAVSDHEELIKNMTSDIQQSPQMDGFNQKADDKTSSSSTQQAKDMMSPTKKKKPASKKRATGSSTTSPVVPNNVNMAVPVSPLRKHAPQLVALGDSPGLVEQEEGESKPKKKHPPTNTGVKKHPPANTGASQTPVLKKRPGVQKVTPKKHPPQQQSAEQKKKQEPRLKNKKDAPGFISPPPISSENGEEEETSAQDHEGSSSEKDAAVQQQTQADPHDDDTVIKKNGSMPKSKKPVQKANSSIPEEGEPKNQDDADEGLASSMHMKVPNKKKKPASSSSLTSSDSPPAMDEKSKKSNSTRSVGDDTTDDNSSDEDDDDDDDADGEDDVPKDGEELASSMHMKVSNKKKKKKEKKKTDKKPKKKRPENGDDDGEAKKSSKPKRRSSKASILPEGEGISSPDGSKPSSKPRRRGSKGSILPEGDGISSPEAAKQSSKPKRRGSKGSILPEGDGISSPEASKPSSKPKRRGSKGSILPEGLQSPTAETYTSKSSSKPKRRGSKSSILPVEGPDDPAMETPSSKSPRKKKKVPAKSKSTPSTPTISPATRKQPKSKQKAKSTKTRSLEASGKDDPEPAGGANLTDYVALYSDDDDDILQTAADTESKTVENQSQNEKLPSKPDKKSDREKVDKVDDYFDRNATKISTKDVNKGYVALETSDEESLGGNDEDGAVRETKFASSAKPSTSTEEIPASSGTDNANQGGQTTADKTKPEGEQRKKSPIEKTANKARKQPMMPMLPMNVPFSDDESLEDGEDEPAENDWTGDESDDAANERDAKPFEAYKRPDPKGMEAKKRPDPQSDFSSPVREPEGNNLADILAARRKMFDRKSGDISPTSVGSAPISPTRKKALVSQKQADYLTAIATPRRGKRMVALETPKGTPRRTLNALNIATPRAKKQSATPPPRRSRKAFAKQDESAILEGYIDSAVALLEDESKQKEVKDAIHAIHTARGFPRSRRLSMRDNELICNLIRAIQNDPQVTTIEVDCDAVFGTVPTTLLYQFIDALKFNLHLKTLQFRGVELGNDVLYALASSLESNFALKKIDLSLNCFTSEGLGELCRAIGSSNCTCVEVNLKDQTTPISVAEQQDVIDALQQNRSLTDVQVDFQSEEAAALVKEIMDRNKRDETKINLDDKVVEVFKDMAEFARELDEEKKSEELVLQVPDDDWDYLYELAVLFDKHKLKKEIQAETDEISKDQKVIKENENLTGKKKSEFLFGQFREILNESVACFNHDGSFLTEEFIAKYLTKDEDTTAVVFDFHGQWKLFKRFPPQDPHRRLIVTKFVDAIVTHSRASEFTGISMANTGCGDDFLVTLSERLTEDDKLLPNLQMLNFETNYINQTGVVAMSKLISHPTAGKYLQVVRLENQKSLLKSKAEVALMRALCVNRSVVVLGLRLRNLLEKQQINKYIVRNIDFIRQARQRHARVTGTQRKRNEVEQIFDKVADNDPSIDKVDMFERKRFLTLTPEEKSKAAASLAHNCFVKTVNFNACGIDDEFAKELGKAIRTNETIEKLFLENNSISGEGIKALFEGLGENKSIEEMRLFHQNKMIITSDEEILADALENNTTITKIGIDLRSKVAQIKLDRKLKHNLNNQLKLRAEAKQGDFLPEESKTHLKF